MRARSGIHFYAIQSFAPGQTFEYTVPDMFGRPWAQIWERYHEEGMARPEPPDIFSFN